MYVMCCSVNFLSFNKLYQYILHRQQLPSYYPTFQCLIHPPFSYYSTGKKGKESDADFQQIISCQIYNLATSAVAEIL